MTRYVGLAIAGFFLAVLWQFPAAPPSEGAADRFAMLAIATAFLLVLAFGLSEIASAIRSHKP